MRSTLPLVRGRRGRVRRCRSLGLAHCCPRSRETQAEPLSVMARSTRTPNRASYATARRRNGTTLVAARSSLSTSACVTREASLTTGSR